MVEFIKTYFEELSIAAPLGTDFPDINPGNIMDILKSG
jgi:hypothetical protein